MVTVSPDAPNTRLDRMKALVNLREIPLISKISPLCPARNKESVTRGGKPAEGMEFLSFRRLCYDYIEWRAIAAMNLIAGGRMSRRIAIANTALKSWYTAGRSVRDNVHQKGCVFCSLRTR